MRRATGFTSISVLALALGGCVDGFRGSNLQLDLPQALKIQPRALGAVATDLPANTHYTIYAIQEDAAADRLFALASFEIHRIVDVTSPCFIDVGEHVPYPGIQVTGFARRVAADTGILDPANPPPTATDQQKVLMATAVERLGVIQQVLGSDTTPLRAVTSASADSYPALAANCTDTDGIPPPTCVDDASNTRRLAACQAAWKAHPDLFEGTDRVLTESLNGTIHGMVDIPLNNPLRLPPTGGAQFFVPEALENISSYAIYQQTDGMDALGTQVLFGRPTAPTRGVSHVHLISPTDATLTAEMAVFADLGQDDVHF